MDEIELRRKMLEEQIALELQVSQTARFMRFSLDVANQNIELIKQQMVQLYRLSEELQAAAAYGAGEKDRPVAPDGPAPSPSSG